MSPPRSSKRRSSAVSSDLLPLFEYSNVINSSLDLRFILNTVLLTVMGKMLVGRGMVLVRRDGEWFEVVAAKGVDHQLLGTMLPLTKPPRKYTAVTPAGTRTRSWMRFFVDRGQVILVPIISQGSVAGFLSLAARSGGKKFSASDKHLISTLVSLSGSALEKAVMVEQLKTANRDADRKYQELNTLFELGKEFNLVLDRNKVIRLLTLSLLGQIGVGRYAMCLRDNETFEVVASRLEEGETIQEVAPQAFSLRTPERTENLVREGLDKELALQLQRMKIQAVIPMVVQNETKGVLFLGPRLRGGGEYLKEDLEFIYSLANLAIISIENARL
ncbi:MAG: GAF domain-containing protein, partial [Bacteroidota bacterium]